MLCDVPSCVAKTLPELLLTSVVGSLSFHSLVQTHCIFLEPLQAACIYASAVPSSPHKCSSWRYATNHNAICSPTAFKSFWFMLALYLYLHSTDCITWVAFSNP